MRASPAAVRSVHQVLTVTAQRGALADVLVEHFRLLEL
jgi:hypothetical protein